MCTACAPPLPTSQLSFTVATSSGRNNTRQSHKTTIRSFLFTVFPPTVEFLWSDSRSLSIRFVHISMDGHRPGLIGDSLISVFTYLKEEDLIVASCVCTVSGVTTCGSSSCRKGTRLLIRSDLSLGLAWSCRDPVVVEVRFNSCTFRWKCPSSAPFPRRRLCLQRWSFCNFAALGTDGLNHSWKRYFLRRSHLEMKMSQGRSGSYTCKSLRGHTGEVHRGVWDGCLRVYALSISRYCRDHWLCS